MNKELERTISLDKSLVAYTKDKIGARMVINSSINEVIRDQKGLDSERVIDLRNKANKTLLTVDASKGVESGFYYKVEDIADWLWEISYYCNTRFQYDEEEILTRQEIINKLIPNIPANLIIKTEKGNFIKRENLNEVLNCIKGTPDILEDDYISKLDSVIVKEKNKKDTGDIKIKATIVLKTKTKNRKNNNESTVSQSQYQQPEPVVDTNVQEQSYTLENDPYESQYSNYSQPTQTNNEINTTANYIKKAIEDYINEDEPEIELKVDYKKKSNLTPEEKKKIRNTIIAAALATITIIASTVSLVGRKNNEKPQPLPESSPTPTATIDLSSVAENPNGEEIIKTEITDEDLYEYIDLGASYYISDNANLYRSGIDTTRAGVTTAGDAKVTSIIICESKKDIEGNTVLENKETISLNDGKLSETNLGKIYNQWLKNVEGNNFVIKVHLSRKNEVTNQEEGYGWVEVNKETFNDLYESLQNSNKITYQ